MWNAIIFIDFLSVEEFPDALLSAAVRSKKARLSACRTRARAHGLCGLALGLPVLLLESVSFANGGRNSCQRKLAFLMGSNRRLQQQHYRVGYL